MRRSVTWFLSTLESFSGKPEAGPTGVLESPTVRIDGREVAFWIGGGKRGVHFALIDRETGREIARATGRNAEPLRRETWQLPESAVGRTAFFRVTDAATGSWGYIAVDGIEFDGTVPVTAELQPPRSFAHPRCGQGQARIRYGSCDHPERTGASKGNAARRHGRFCAVRGKQVVRDALQETAEMRTTIV